MNHQRTRQTREQMRLERISTVLMAAGLIVLCAVLAVWALGIWAEHPAEQHISGTAYVVSVRNGDVFDDLDY